MTVQDVYMAGEEYTNANGITFKRGMVGNIPVLLGQYLYNGHIVETQYFVVTHNKFRLNDSQTLINTIDQWNVYKRRQAIINYFMTRKIYS